MKITVDQLQDHFDNRNISEIARCYGISRQNLRGKQALGFMVEPKKDGSLVFSREGKVEKILLEQLKPVPKRGA